MRDQQILSNHLPHSFSKDKRGGAESPEEPRRRLCVNPTSEAETAARLLRFLVYGDTGWWDTWKQLFREEVSCERRRLDTFTPAERKPVQRVLPGETSKMLITMLLAPICMLLMLVGHAAAGGYPPMTHMKVIMLICPP
ncbi:unnamed protein product [Menidia menidia]|uniref:(Atlantic silverside) hypothetical protein n=1 Tax=Menidia menidia TaxID=238744 RepID=A0A8S4ALX0_9TELE|nr:unnamed protein product [Menidia menidia]